MGRITKVNPCRGRHGRALADATHALRVTNVMFRSWLARSTGAVCALYSERPSSAFPFLYVC